MAATAAERCIILAEDDELFRRAVREVLERSGLATQVVACRDGVEFMAAIGERLGRPGGVALAILDIMMPQMDGWEVLKLLEAGHHVAQQQQPRPLPPDAAQLALFAGAPPHPLLAELDRLDLDSLSPIDALNRLAAWKKRLEKT